MKQHIQRDGAPRRALYASLLTIFLIAAASFPVSFQQADDANPPAETVKLIFIHHSTGENWLTDGYGNLGRTLGENNYFVSDTNYGWGPDVIGDRTDIPNWTEWFASENTPTYMDALFNESGQNASYTRTLSDPGGENQIVMFKSCFPNSALEGNPNDPPDPEGWLSVGHAKYVYNEILKYFGTRPDKLFVVITAPPLSDSTYSTNARAFNDWLLNDWLRENNYALNNVAVFDFYNVLTSPNAHHRFNNGQIEHLVTDSNTLYYPSGDDHPSEQGSQKATEEFLPLLNIFYHRWKATAQTKPPEQATLPPAAAPTNAAPPPASTSNLLDDLEHGTIPDASGWEGYFEDGTDTKITCALDSSRAHGGANSLQFQFDVTPNSWATCGFYFGSTKNWSAGQGISFYMRADKAGIPFDVDLYGGSPDAHTLYIHALESSAESVNDWVLIQIPWSEILRAEWEENPGSQFNPAEATGFSIGLSSPEQSRVAGTLWLDDLSLMGGVDTPVVEAPASAPSTEATEQAPVAPSPARPSLCSSIGFFPLIALGLMLIGRKSRF